MGIMHSRFAEIRRYYTAQSKEDLGVIPIEHAHPNIDKQQRIALFHNGFIANFHELKLELQGVKDLKNLTDSQVITALISDQLDQGKNLKDALISIVEHKLLGTYRIAVMELKNPKCMFFVKNSGDFSIGLSKKNTGLFVSSDLTFFNEPEIKQVVSHPVAIPNNSIVTVMQDCTYTIEKLEKKIQIQKKPKTRFEHIMHEEIIESIDAIDLATDFGGKFISDHQVILGGF
jgi:glutamine---fructose-6-phosphate transaminase (isomerizing)